MAESAIHILAIERVNILWVNAMRRRNPDRLHRIADAATTEFIDRGFTQAKVSHVADRAGVGPGTVYLYVADKEALFELALRRAWGDSTVAFPDLPFRQSSRTARRNHLEALLNAATEFPQLWVAGERRSHSESSQEYEEVLLEVARWIWRYRSGLLLLERNRREWPELGGLLDQAVWADLSKRLTDLLSVRAAAGHLMVPAHPKVVGQFLLEAVTGFALSPNRGPVADETVAVVVHLLTRALVPRPATPRLPTALLASREPRR
jgi:AcrR family transcriptional regulator